MVIVMPNKLSKRIIRCECIDGETLADLKFYLITARDTYQDVSERFPELKTGVRKINDLIDEFARVKTCPER